jgi:hypothetical protein
MCTDANQAEIQVAGPRFELPRLVEVTIRRVPFEAPRHRHFRSRLSELSEAIEFRVRTDRPLNLSTAITPVLFVGDTILTEGEQVGRNTYTFLAFEKDRLEPGAPVSLAYPYTPADARPASRFRYHEPSSDDQ